MEPEPTIRPRPRQTRWTILLATIGALVLGGVAGLGGYTFVYAKGGSYLTDNPAACANCHVMQEKLDGWVKASHRSVATCNDCHTPANFALKYLTKADHGFFHSLAFTTNRFHEPIEMKERSRRVTEKACRKCHQDTVHDIEAMTPHGQTLSCIRCHASVGHLE